MKLRSIAILLTFLLAAPLAAAASLPEYQVKAAFLHSFGKYVIWPPAAFAAPTAPFVIGILGSDPFGEAFVALQQKHVQNHPLEIRRIGRISEARGCHILFISRSEQQRLGALLAGLKGLNALTVSDIDGFAREGGMIQLLLQDNQVRFEINLRAAQAEELTLSSSLLNLATAIRE